MRHMSRFLQVKAASVTTMTGHLLRLSMPFDIKVPGHHTFHASYCMKETFSDPGDVPLLFSSCHCGPKMSVLIDV